MNDQRGHDAPSESTPDSRRSFLKRSALITAVPATVTLGGAVAEAATRPGKAGAPLPYQNDTNWLSLHVLNIVNSENAHLAGLLTELGVFARPSPTFNIPAPTNLRQFLQMGSTFCTVGAGAYLGSATAVSNPTILTQAGSIGQAEMTQAGFLNAVLGGTFMAGGSPYAIPLTLDQVISAASPYITSLNGGPPIGFNPNVKSYENDIAILNTALVLEYLEHAFYNTYYPVFFK